MMKTISCLTCDDIKMLYVHVTIKLVKKLCNSVYIVVSEI
jgi:hypothetical protein